MTKPNPITKDTPDFEAVLAGRLQRLKWLRDEGVKHPLADDSREVKKIVDEILAAHNQAVEAAELYVAKWFDNGVPTGFTVESWLAVARATFDENGSPTDHPTTQEARANDVQTPTNQKGD